MEKEIERTKKAKVNKGQLTIKIMCGVLAVLMIFSTFATVGYYLFSSFAK